MAHADRASSVRHFGQEFRVHKSEDQFGKFGSLGRLHRSIGGLLQLGSCARPVNPSENVRFSSFFYSSSIETENSVYPAGIRQFSFLSEGNFWVFRQRRDRSPSRRQLPSLADLRPSEQLSRPWVLSGSRWRHPWSESKRKKLPQTLQSVFIMVRHYRKKMYPPRFVRNITNRQLFLRKSPGQPVRFGHRVYPVLPDAQLIRFDPQFQENLPLLMQDFDRESTDSEINSAVQVQAAAIRKAFSCVPTARSSPAHTAETQPHHPRCRFLSLPFAHASLFSL